MKKLNLAAAFIAGMGNLFAGSIDKLNAMTAEECINYTLEDKAEGHIVTAEIRDGKSNAKFYWFDDKEENRNVVFEIGSLTKTFTAALICRAQSEGKLNIEDSISKYLNLDNDKFYPSIKSLLTHTSGYKPYYMAKGMSKNHLNKKNDFYGITKQQILDQVRKTKLCEHKEYNFNYSNFGYAVLGLVLESVYDKTYTELVNDFAQNDLGMKNTRIADGKGNQSNYWDWAAEDAYLSAGGLYSTIDDMIIYANAQLSEEGIFAECHKMFADSKASTVNQKMGIFMDKVGYAWILDSKNNVIWHNGGTGDYNCYLGFNLEQQKAVIVLSNLAPGYKIPATVVGTKMMSEN